MESIHPGVREVSLLRRDEIAVDLNWSGTKVARADKVWKAAETDEKAAEKKGNAPVLSETDKSEPLRARVIL